MFKSPNFAPPAAGNKKGLRIGFSFASLPVSALHAPHKLSTGSFCAVRSQIPQILIILSSLILYKGLSRHQTMSYTERVIDLHQDKQEKSDTAVDTNPVEPTSVKHRMDGGRAAWLSVAGG